MSAAGMSVALRRRLAAAQQPRRVDRRHAPRHQLPVDDHDRVSRLRIAEQQIVGPQIGVHER
jgi:hypothetical protein